MMAVLPSPRIEISKDGPLFRLSIDPADALPPSAMRPATHASHLSATREAGIVRAATGWPIIDRTLTVKGGGS